MPAHDSVLNGFVFKNSVPPNYRTDMLCIARRCQTEHP